MNRLVSLFAFLLAGCGNESQPTALSIAPPCGGKYKAGHVFWNKDGTGGLRLVNDLDDVRSSSSFVAFGDVEQPQLMGLVTPKQKEVLECITTCSCQ